MKKFLKSNELNLVNGGYVSTVKEGAPVTNEAFIAAQKQAEYVITFAKLAKTKNFKETKVDSLADLRAEVAEILEKKAKKFVAAPKKVEKKLTSQLAKEALAFMDFEKESSNVDKINNFLQKFEVISEFEEFGLFFEEGIVKLNKIYTMEEIIKAVQETIELLD